MDPDTTRKPEDIDTFQLDNEVWDVRNPTDRTLKFESNFAISKTTIEFAPGEVKAFPLGMAKWLAERIARDMIITKNLDAIEKIADKTKTDPLANTFDRGTISDLLPAILIRKTGTDKTADSDNWGGKTYLEMQQEATRRGINPVQKREVLSQLLKSSN